MKLRGGALRETSLALEQVCPRERMRISGIDMFFGPTPHAPVPTILCRLEAGTGLPSAGAVLNQLNDGLLRHVNAPRRDSPTDAPALASWVASLAAGLLKHKLMIPVASGTSRSENGSALFWVEKFASAAVLQAIDAALVAVGAALEGRRDTGAVIGPLLRRLDVFCEQLRPNNESRILIDAARKRDLPLLQIADNHALWQFGWGERSNQFWVTSSNADGMVGRRMASDKDLTKRLLRQLGLPTPDWRLVGLRGDFQAAAQAIGWPCVVKPFTGGAGRGVTANIRDPAMLERAVEIARQSAPLVLVERHQPGSDHRLMVVHGRLAMAVRRDPPQVEGDGRRTVGELIEALNAEREDEGGYLEAVPDDDVVRVTLAGEGVDHDTVLPRGKQILLRGNANHATGGTCTDVLDQVHPQIRQMCEHMAAATGFRTVGIDYITTDISRSHDEVGGGFIEINSTPGMQVLITGRVISADLGEVVIGKRPDRIPIRFLLVPKEQEETVADILKSQPAPGMGIATAGWAQVGQLRLSAKSLRAAGRVAAVLRYPTVRNLVILWTAETLARFGLPVDAVDQTVILGPPPSEEWVAMLRDRSRSLTFVDTPAEAAAAGLAHAYQKSPARRPRNR